MNQANNNNLASNRRTPNNRSAAFDPKAPSLVQPYKRLVDEGFITELVATFTPTGFTCLAKPDSRLADVEDSNLEEGEQYPIGVLAMWADKGNLIPLKGKKSKNKTGTATPDQPLPAKSLCKKDFEGTAAELSARAVAVANNSGGPALIGRVRSEKSFKMNVTTSFQNWWAQASVDARASALSTPRYRGELTPDLVAKLSNLQCPFRGSAEFSVTKDEKEAKSGAEPTSPGSAKTPGQAVSPPKKTSARK